MSEIIGRRIGKFLRQDAFTDGSMICVGAPPEGSELTPFKNKNEFNRMAKLFIPKRPRKAVELKKVNLNGMKCVDFKPKSRIQEMYIKYVLKRFPEAIFYCGNVMGGGAGERVLLGLLPSKKIICLIAPVRMDQ